MEDLKDTKPNSPVWGEWVKMLTQDGYLNVLKQMAMQGELKRSNIRSVCWKLFLGVLPEEKSKWISVCESTRKQYVELKDKHFIDPHSEESLDVSVNNPLSQSEDSPWNQFFKDNDLKTIITQDVVRTFPEVEFFRADDVRNMMISILLCYCKEHPEIGYRQGMHELLAPVLFVMAIERRENIENDPTLSPDLRVVMDPSFTEHDSYIIFHEIMEFVTPWYINESSQLAVKVANSNNKWVDPRHATPFQKEDISCTSALTKKVEKIQNILLRKTDPELFQHLNTLDILPQVYGIRWMRLLFGREFPFPSVLELWDSIFADSSSMSLVEYVCVAMLILIRQKLMVCDNAGIMQLLMQYPWNTSMSSTWDINDLVQMALHFRKPEAYQLSERAEKLFLFSRSQEDSSVMLNHPQLNKQPVSGKNTKFFKLPKRGSATQKAHSSPSRHRAGLPPSPQLKSSRPNPAPSNQITHRLPQQLTHGHQGSSQKAKQHTTHNLSEQQTVAKERNPRELQVNPPQSAAANNAVTERLGMLEAMCKICGEKMETHLRVIQDEVLEMKLSDETMETMFMNLAELKRIRDVLQGKLPFAGVFPSWAIASPVTKSPEMPGKVTNESTDHIAPDETTDSNTEASPFSAQQDQLNREELLKALFSDNEVHESNDKDEWANVSTEEQI